jgi:hypothetical protein
MKNNLSIRQLFKTCEQQTKIKSTDKIYNGLSIREILTRMPTGLREFKLHRNIYINNCIFVYECERDKVNLEYSNATRNTNNLIIKMYY